MTRHPKIDVNEKIIKDIAKSLEKTHLTNLMTETFTKQDMINAIVFIWNQRNLPTNDKIEKYINVNFFRKNDDGQY
jgi:hypothetical protein